MPVAHSQASSEPSNLKKRALCGSNHCAGIYREHSGMEAISVKYRSRLRIRSRAYAKHLWQKFLGLTAGPLVVTEAGIWIRTRFASLRKPVPVPAVRAAVVGHVYYTDLFWEILRCRDVLPGTVPLHVTVPLDRVEDVRAASAGHANVYIHPCENRGRDIAPFISLLNAGILDDYDAVLKLHTKRSPHLRDGEIRRKLLFTMLCGERNAACRVLASFLQPDTGLVGWASSYRTNRAYWMANEERVRGLALRMKIDRAPKLGFFEGSMFWCRPSALARLRQLNFQPTDFEPENRQLDATLHHALERCFTIAAWADGFVVRDLRGKLLD